MFTAELITVIVKVLTLFDFHSGFHCHWLEEDNEEREETTRDERRICDFVTTDRRDCSDRKEPYLRVEST